jgi:LPXTG-motif cell wall-anchored protein
VTYTVEVDNDSVEPVTLTALTDDIFGDLLDPANLLVDDNTCPTTPMLIGIGATFTCTFDADLVGDFGDPDHVNTVTATAQDDELNSTTDTDTETVAFDEVEPALLSGSVWLDLDGDVVRSSGEPGLVGVTVNLLDDGGVEIATTTTNADGGYGFSGLDPGTYTVEVDELTVPAGVVLVGDPDVVLDAEATVTLDAGEDRDDLDFAYEGTGSIGDTVWLDEDEDGILDSGEDRIAGVVVELVWAGFDGIFGTTDDWSFPIEVTGSDGTYRFWDLPPGEYEVEVDLDTVSDDLTPTTPVSIDVELGPAEDYDDGDVGFAPSDDEPLPQTGIEAQTLGLWGLILTLLGLLLLIIGRRGNRRDDMHWDRL